MQGDKCTYSTYSFQFYVLFPLIRLCYLLKVPGILSYGIACAVPAYLIDYLIGVAKRNNYVTLVEHAPEADHPHSSAITSGVIIRSALLGILMTIGLSLLDNGLQPHFRLLGIYLMILSFFHFSEYFVTSLTNPSSLCLSSFLLDQSTAYVLAISGSLAEFVLEAYMFPSMKQFNTVAIMGLVVAITGEAIRKSAMFTAGRNFTHTISSEKSPNHQLVTHGIYSLFRHPSYAGWFYWAVGSQILLLNPICTLLFAIVSYRFFKDRIKYEETTLVEFFGRDYENYRKRVGLWMPIS